MFQAREPQESPWQSECLITPRKARLMRKSWAEVFRNEALVLIEEERFAPMYSPDMGRPNRAVQTVLGVLVLKEMFDLTDMEALEELEFNLLWHHALRLEMEEAHLAQKTLHNFRVRLMEHDGGRLAFCETTDRMIEALGLGTGRQRLDSTHVMSNIALLTRLGLFCETVRVFLLAVSPVWVRGLGMDWPSGTSRRPVKHRGTRTHVQVRGDAGCRCARETCTGWCIGSVVRRWQSWRSTVCWRGFWGSSAMWAGTGTVVQWRKRYGLRAGIEGTNSELKRRHGLGRLRVRGGERVRLAVYLKALACNVKRMIRARLDEMLVPAAVLATALPTA